MNVQAQSDLVRPFNQAWNVADRNIPQPVGNRAAQVIRQAFSSGDTVTLTVPESVKGAIKTLAEKTLSELPPNGAVSAFDFYA
ncbi:MAG: hypothetical protein H7833_09745 [Magnetococcus sp. DMHC-1]|nr:hypothetical protein [Magnetococcales bacterium]